MRQEGIPANPALRDEIARRMSILWMVLHHGYCNREEAEGGGFRSESAYHLGLEGREMDSREKKLDGCRPDPTAIVFTCKLHETEFSALFPINI